MATTLVLSDAMRGHLTTVAAAVAHILRTAAKDVVLVSDARRGAPGPEGFDRVIVVAPIHGERVAAPVRRWVRAHAAGLNARPTALILIDPAIVADVPEGDRHLETISVRFPAAVGWRPVARLAYTDALPCSQHAVVTRRFAQADEGFTALERTSPSSPHQHAERLRAFVVEFAAHADASRSGG